jgi:hypothetical protein
MIQWPFSYMPLAISRKRCDDHATLMSNMNGPFELPSGRDYVTSYDLILEASGDSEQNEQM